MSIRNCPECGRIFEFVFKNLCPECIQKEDIQQTSRRKTGCRK